MNFARTTVGLDLGTRSVKFVQLGHAAKGLTLLKADCKEFPGTVESFSIEWMNEAVKMIKGMWLTHRLPSKAIRVTFSHPEIYSRQITVPKVAEDELNKAIRWQAEKYIPFPVEEAVVDYQILETGVSQDQTQMDIFLIVVQRKLLDRYLEIMDKAGLSLEFLEVAPFSVAKACLTLCAENPDEIVPVIDIGDSFTSLTVIHGSELQFVRSFECAGIHFTRSILEHLGIGFEQAEEFKRKFVFNSSPERVDDESRKVFEFLEPVLHGLAEQIQRSFAFCGLDMMMDKVQKIFVCGGGAKFQGLTTYLNKYMSMNFVLVDPFHKMAISKNFLKNQRIEESKIKLMAACGAAL